jgi:hypothetical protein
LLITVKRRRLTTKRILPLLTTMAVVLALGIAHADEGMIGQNL